MARGSASELEYRIFLARDLNFLDETTYKSPDGKLLEVKKCWPR
jgi:hypothetical protein